MSKLTTTAVTAALALSTNIYAVNPNSGQTSTSQTLNIEITSPGASDNVDISADLAVEGRVNIGAVPSTGRSNVAFVIDVSGSTSSSGNDCNNDGQVDAGDNFTPNDSREGTVLDCEVGAVMALNDSLGANGSVSTAIIAFGSSASTAQDFTTPPSNDENSNGMSDIDDTLVQLDQRGGIVSVGVGTDFGEALVELTRLMNTRPANEQRVAYFLTDGESSRNITTQATAARDAGIRVEAFSVGNGAASCASSTLGEIATITGGTCTEVQDITTLTAVIGNTSGVPPTGIDRVTLSANGGAANNVAVDNLGNWQGTIAASELASGTNTIEATVFAQDGTAVLADLMFNAMGDEPVLTPVDPMAPDTPVTIDPILDDPMTPVTPVTVDPTLDDPMTPVTPVTVDPTTPVTPDTPEPTAPTTNNMMGIPGMMGMLMAQMFCADGSATDLDGDGFGWENNMTCLVQGSSFDQSRVIHPACTLSDSDQDGDGFGWENNATCVIPGSAAAALID